MWCVKWAMEVLPSCPCGLDNDGTWCATCYRNFISESHHFVNLKNVSLFYWIENVVCCDSHPDFFVLLMPILLSLLRRHDDLRFTYIRWRFFPKTYLPGLQLGVIASIICINILISFAIQKKFYHACTNSCKWFFCFVTEAWIHIQQE